MARAMPPETVGVCVLETEKLLNFSCEMGRQLLRNGAEIYRVEVFAIPSCIILNIQEGERNYTKSIRVRAVRNNLRRLSQLNALCRDICRETPDYEEADRRFQVILHEPEYPRGVSYLAHGVVAFFFTLFWGGGSADALTAFFCGLLVKMTLSFMRRVQANVFFTNVVTSMLLALVPLLLVCGGAGLNADKTIIGSIMLLVPGIAITNVMRDVLAGDFLTAVTRLTEVLIVGMGITIGVAMAITVTRPLAGLL